MASNDIRAISKKTQFQSGEKAVESGRKGGIKSGEAKRKKKTMKEALEMFLEMNLDTSKVMTAEDRKKFGYDEEISVNDAIMYKAIQKARKGDLKAIEFVRDSIGQKPDTAMKLGLDIPVLFAGEDKLEDE